MTSTILFDFDGVLVDSIEIFSEAVNVAGRNLRQPVSFVPDDLRAIRRMSIPEIVQKANVDPSLSKEFVVEIDRELFRRHSEIHMFPEMNDIVRELRHLGKIGIVSATSVAVIEGVMKNHQLRESIETVVGGDMPGTKAEKIKAIVARNGSTESQTCMIGDTVSDIEQSRNAGVISIAVSWGWHSIDWIRTAGPDYEAHQPKDLVSLVKQHVLPSRYPAHSVNQTAN